VLASARALWRALAREGDAGPRGSGPPSPGEDAGLRGTAPPGEDAGPRGIGTACIGSDVPSPGTSGRHAAAASTEVKQSPVADSRPGGEADEEFLPLARKPVADSTRTRQVECIDLRQGTGFVGGACRFPGSGLNVSRINLDFRQSGCPRERKAEPLTWRTPKPGRVNPFRGPTLRPGFSRGAAMPPHKFPLLGLEEVGQALEQQRRSASRDAKELPSATP
jgi:hypothetical protein